MNTNLPLQDLDAGLCSLASTYADMIIGACDSDSTLSPVALASGQAEQPLVPIHWAAVQTIASLSRTADEDSLPALLLALRKIYEAPRLCPDQFAGLLALAVRTNDLVCADRHALTLEISTRGQVSSSAYGRVLQLSGDWWILRIGQATAHHLHLAGGLRHAQAIAPRVPIPASFRFPFTKRNTATDFRDSNAAKPAQF